MFVICSEEKGIEAHGETMSALVEEYSRRQRKPYGEHPLGARYLDEGREEASIKVALYDLGQVQKRFDPEEYESEIMDRGLHPTELELWYIVDGK